MAKKNIRIQYLYHSGFRVETDTHVLIFDYFKGNVRLGDKKLLVFCSHGHADHFNPQIFEWQDKSADIQYILSQDIEIAQKKPNIYQISPYDEIIVGDVSIKAFGSTDVGVSFLVQCAGICFFHAGDLNWWHWWQDIPEEIANAEGLFKDEMNKIKGERIDIAFFPVDPRLERYASLGADYFIEEIAPKYLIPMHFGDAIDTAKRYAESKKGSTTKVMAITQSRKEIQIEITGRLSHL